MGRRYLPISKILSQTVSTSIGPAGAEPFFDAVTFMNWVYWNTFWSLVGSLVWFMTIVTHPDSVVVDRHPPKPDESRRNG
jgi:hypothetical protein